MKSKNTLIKKRPGGDSECLSERHRSAQCCGTISGGKWRLAPWIIDHMPQHEKYVEPYGGAASVLLRKPPCMFECYNDLSGQVVNVLRQVRDRGEELEEKVRATPFSEREFERSYEPCDDDLERARRTIVRSYMGHGSAAVTKEYKTGFRWKAFRQGTSLPQDWNHYPDHMAAVRERLKNVTITERDALKVMRGWDAKDCLHYVDPPYVDSTRTSSSDCYEHEMTNADHREMAEVLHGLDGMVILSGYTCDLYKNLFAGWHEVQREAMASSQNSSVARTESLWLNPAAQANQHQQTLFNANCEASA